MAQNINLKEQNNKQYMESSLLTTIYINIKQFIMNNNNNFKMIIADEKGFQIITQLFKQNEILDMNIVAIIKLLQQGIDLISVLQQNLCNIQIIAHSDSLQQVMELLSNNYQYLNQIQVLFINQQIQNKLADLQMLNVQTQFTIPKDFLCTQVNCDCRLYNKKIIKCKDIQSALDLFEGEQYFSTVTLISAYMKQENDIQMNYIKQMFSYGSSQQSNAVEGDQNGNNVFGQQLANQNGQNNALFIVSEEASIKNLYVLSYNYFSLLTRFYPLANILLNYIDNPKINDILIQHIDDIMIYQNYENIQKELGLPDNQTLNITENEQLYKIIYEQDILYSLQQQVELTNKQLSLLKQKETNILKDNNVMEISKFQEEKNSLNQQMKVQGLIVRLIKDYKINEMIKVYDDLKNGSINTSDQSVTNILNQQKSQYLINLLKMYLKCLNPNYQFDVINEYLQRDYQLITQIKYTQQASNIGTQLINKIKSQVNHQTQTEIGQFIRQGVKQPQLNIQFIRESDNLQQVKKTVLFIGQSANLFDFSELVDSQKDNNVVDNIIVVSNIYSQSTQ